MKKNKLILTAILALSIAATLVGCGDSNDIADNTITTSAYVSVDGTKETPSQVSSETKVDGTVVAVFSDGTIIETTTDGSKKEITPDGVVTIVEQPTIVAPTIEPTQAPVIVVEETTIAPTQAPTPVIVETPNVAPIPTPTPEPIEHTQSPTYAPIEAMVSTFPDIKPWPSTVVPNGLSIEFQDFMPSMSELNGAYNNFFTGIISASEAKARLMSLTGNYDCKLTNGTYTTGTCSTYYADAGFFKKGECDLNNTALMQPKPGFLSSFRDRTVDGTKYIYWAYVQMVKN